MRMPFWVRFVPSLPRYRLLDLPLRNLAFFLQTVRNHDSGIAVEEVQNPVVHAGDARAELVYSIAQIVGLRPAQFVP